jgi:cell division protein FtsN
MATRRRNTGSARRRKPPGWALVLAGLALGAVLMVGTQYLLAKVHRPFPGLANLFTERAPVEERKKPGPAPARPVKPKFDFYTVLPEIETVLPERSARPERRPPPSATTKPETDVRYMLQAASFAQHQDADRLRAKLALNGLEANIEKVTIEGKGDFYRVRLGPYARLEDLDAANQRLAAQGIQALRLKVKAAP